MAMHPIAGDTTLDQRHRRAPLRSVAALTAASLVAVALAVGGSTAYGADKANEHRADHQAVGQSTTARSDAEEYWEWIGKTLAPVISDEGELAGPTGATPPPTAAEQFQNAIAYTQKLSQEFREVRPPAQFASAHRSYQRALNLQERTFRDALAKVDSSQPFDAYYTALYSVADSAYAFVAESDAKCALNRAADSWGYEQYDFQRFCNPTPRPGDAVGSATQPVNDITLVNEKYGDGKTLPNLWYDVTSITAEADRPITITFDNRNTGPFLFNIAIYKGNPKNLAGRTPVSVTQAAPGPSVHKLTVKLKPGIYTYTDNVHAYSMRGVLRVM